MIQSFPAWWRGLNKARPWLVVVFILLALSSGTWWYLAAEDRVCLVVDGQASIIRTRASHISGLLKQAGVSLSEGDVADPPVTTEIKEGLTVKIARAFPMELVVGDETRKIKTIPCSVSQLLRTFRITLNKEDRIEPGLCQEVKPGQTVRVIRVSFRETAYREEIAPPVTYRKDAQLEQGLRYVLKEGHTGLVQRRALICLENGRESSRRILSTEWIRHPQEKLVVLGTKPPIHTFLTSRGQEVHFTRILNMIATGYDTGPESCGVNAKGITRTGARATYGVVAVDPRVIPLGTKLYVEGYGFATALDTGSAIKGSRIDLCFDTYREAEMYGKRKIKVYVLSK